VNSERAARVGIAALAGAQVRLGTAWIFAESVARYAPVGFRITGDSTLAWFQAMLGLRIGY
jgi:hypothetical protein